MKIFLTGGTGFVGQNIIPVLIAEGHEIHAMTRSTAGAEKLKQLGANPILDDLCNLSENTVAGLAKCDAVVHSAAHMDFTYDKKRFFETNVAATQKLLELSQKGNIGKFIYISAAPVVPGSPIRKLKEAEAGTGLPTALYPRSKAIAEKAVLAANEAGFTTISLRPPAIWGPNNHHYEELFAAARAGKWRWIGGGHHILSTIHVRNLANAIVAALRSGKGGEAYFVTDGDRRSMRTTFTRLMEAHGINPGEKELPRWVAVGMAHLLGGIWKTLGLKSRPPVAPIMIRLMGTEFSVNDEKARTQLGYENAIGFEEGISALEAS